MADLGDGLNNARNNARGVNEEIKSLYEQLRGVTSEIKGQATSISKSREAFRAFEKGAQNLKLQYEGINNLTDDQVKKLSQQLTKQKAIAEQEVNNLKAQNSYIQKLDEEIALLKEQGDTKEGIAEYALRQIQLASDLSDEEKAILSSFYDQENVMGNITEEAKKEAALRDEINNKLGITGAALTALKDLSPALAKGLKIDEVADGMRKFADTTLRNKENVSRLRVAAEGAKIAFKNLGDTLTDPAVIGGALIKGFTDVQNAQKEFRSITGQNINQFDTLNTSILTSAEYIKSAANLSKELGINAAVVFSPETIAEVGELTEQMGLGVKEAANLAKFSKLSGQELSNVTKNIESSTKNFIKTNKVGVNLKDVMSDVGGVSDSISLSLGGNPQKITDAALAARELGVSLEQVDKIAGSLLNFESSISAELEAELLTGQQLNLEKARELALSNDLEGVAKELTKNQGIMNAFASGNRIQQEAVAKAMGMSREEMSQMIYQQQLQSGLSSEQAAKAADISLEEAKRLTVQKQISNAIDKITQAFGGILTIISPLLQNTTALSIVMGTIASVYAVKMVSSFASSAKDSFNILKNVLSLGKASKAATSAVEGIEGAVAKSGDKAADVANKSKNIKPNAGGGIKSFLRNLSNGLKSMSGGKVLQGALNLIPASLGFVAMLPAIPSLLFFGLIPLKQLESNFEGLANGLNLMSGTFVGSAALGAFGIAATLAIPSLIFLAGISLIGPAARVGLNSLGSGLMGLGSFAATGIPFLGIALIAALGAAMIPFAIAMNFAAPAIEAVGSVILSVFTGIATVITAVADGFTKMFGSLNPENIGALLVLGPALLGISAGLAAMSITGLLAMPTILALTALGTVAEGLGSIFGGGDGESSSLSEEGSLKAVENKLDKLIAVVEQGGDVFIDGNKVGKSLQLASSKIG